MRDQDREAVPTAAKFATPMRDIDTAIRNPDRLERALQIARWIVTLPHDKLRPLHADSWPAHNFDGFEGAALYGKHRAAVTWVESENATRLQTLTQCLLDVEIHMASARTQEAAERASKAVQHLGGLLVGLWGVGPRDLPSPDAQPYVPVHVWAAKRALLPQCLPLDQRTREFASEEERRKVRDFTGAPSYRGRSL